MDANDAIILASLALLAGGVYSIVVKDYMMAAIMALLGFIVFTLPL